MSKTYEIGSEWRKWDFHIHSPNSIIQNYTGEKEDAWENFLTALEGLPEEVKVIGINDYYFIDGYEKAMDEKVNKGRLKNIEKIFPIIEFRIDTFASASESNFSKVNMHFLFDVDESNLKEEIAKIKSEFIENISIVKTKPTKKLTKENFINESSNKSLKTGFAELIPPTDKVLELANDKEWKNKIIKFLGYGEWNNLEKGNQLKLYKKQLYQEADAFLTASLDDTFGKKKEVISIFGKKPLLHSLDIHDFDKFKNYTCNTWVKANPTFQGLKHSLKESSLRIYIGDFPKQTDEIDRRKDCYIEKLAFHSESNDKEWFDGIKEVPLNPGLVAIIGNKGTGKSALADLLAVTGNSYQKHLSFLNRERFLSLPAHKKYSFEISFKDNFKNNVSLKDPRPDKNKEEKLIYLSQNFVKNLCENDTDPQDLQDTIDRVIFSHLPEEERFEQHNLKDLISIRGRKYDIDRQEQFVQLKAINRTIVDKEKLLNPEHKAKLGNQINELERQLSEIEKDKPEEKKKSDDSGNKVYLKRLEEYSSLISSVEQRVKKEQGLLNKTTINVHNLEELTAEAKSLERNYLELLGKLKKDPILQEEKIDDSKIISFNFDESSISKVTRKFKAKIDDQKKYCSRLNMIKDKSKNLSDVINKKLGIKDKEYQDYLIKIKEWEKKKANLIGDKDIPGSIKYLKNQLSFVNKELNEELTRQYKKRQDLAKNILKSIQDKESALTHIYFYSQDEAKRNAEFFKIPRNQFVEFNTETKVSDNFSEVFFGFINQNRSGTFYKVEPGEEQLKIIENEFKGEIKNLIEFPGRIISALQHNLATDPNGSDPYYKTELEEQLATNKSKLDLYDFLFSFDYVESNFMLTYNGKKLNLLSPGERGLLLLIFYLLIDKDDRPIIIDQPEENLDNETVYKSLVAFIRSIKNKRQIIMVTHNPNLAIVCDADQIIFCDINKLDKNLIRYTAGSIEDEFIKNCSINVLEGTKPAFVDRRDKYEISG